VLTCLFCLLLLIEFSNDIFSIPRLDSLISGYFLVSVAAILDAAVTFSDLTCILQQWCFRIGFACSVLPLLLKISIINKLGRDARRFRRYDIDEKRFRKIFVLFICGIASYLIVWTIVDMPRAVENLTLTYDTSSPRSIGGSVVLSSSGCDSRNDMWEILLLVEECLLLLSTMVLTYQSREVLGQLSESHRFAALVYSHSLFTVIRMIVKLLYYTDLITGEMGSKFVSIIIGVEVVFGIAVYFIPKFQLICTNDRPTHVHVETITTGGGGPGQQRRTTITGINIPAGGIPNLIRPKPGHGIGNVNVAALRARASSHSDNSGRCNSTPKKDIIDSCIFEGKDEDDIEASEEDLRKEGRT